VREIIARNSPRRVDAVRDADNYADMFAMSPADRADLSRLHEEHEAQSKVALEEIRAALAPAVVESQAPLLQALETMGAIVESTTIAGNLIVARVPAALLADVAALPGVAHVGADKLARAHLDMTDETTLVTTPAAGGGPWDNGYTGGQYDPAVIDSGIDLGHPALADNASRTNWSSWYLVSAIGSSQFNETCCSIEDLEGHGTHVSGIVGSYGMAGYEDHLGMAYGVEKMVHLKAGWLNTSGGTSMFWSDKYDLVDRALYDIAALSPLSSFNDDLDGINLSYGGVTTDDDTAAGRFWDSVVATYSDLVVTVSAGDTGPSNQPAFMDPASAWNVITVANASDQGTVSRADDVIAASSTRGPTPGGRRKPDLAAYGTGIAAPNTFWEGNLDFVPRSGTSAAAPVVLGVAMSLMDAGVWDEKAIKALLINTAQKNEIGIENDADGWDSAAGWGLLNAYAAYYHRLDVRQAQLEPRGGPGVYPSYVLSQGVMEDEGPAGEGRDRATLVWNREAVYQPGGSPAVYHDPANLDLDLYREADDALIDSDRTVRDNVQQVRIDSGAGPTEVVLKVYTDEAAFADGDASKGFAIATEEGFVVREFPASFQGLAALPDPILPDQDFEFAFWIRNDSALASHKNSLDLELPEGFTLVSGQDTVDVGSAPAGGMTGVSTWQLRAPALVPDPVGIIVRHSHESYGEQYGPFDWNTATNAAARPNITDATAISLAASQVESGGDTTDNADVTGGAAGILIPYTATGSFTCCGSAYLADNLNDGDIGTGVASDGFYATPDSGTLTLDFGSTKTVGSIAIYNGYTNRDDGAYTLRDGDGNLLGSWTITTPSGSNSNDGADSFWLHLDPPVTTSALQLEFTSQDAQGTVSFREIQVFAPAVSVPASSSAVRALVAVVLLLLGSRIVKRRSVLRV